ncbi:hypothetical protein [Paenibacillus mucilaginosus]|uniref:Uncharacterized protein n=1 Tax=Paenibacillus mucilaginosus (strain KNP414) TaxID=1036673 RepID=F8FCV9_PAEMK|nr:hypothetical protein [Paenibacillus mucilaginosus]AEI39681.1 hypothetical protein KNP414_01113 [Paenibacillus mucilaginosus KNP414]MCG7217768.1 hypothetical protein [Paenibacillus mucilaginosus]WDM28983.1 hypothetical protein KCX80_07360 [Paenibacillus mucilaginosus]
MDNNLQSEIKTVSEELKNLHIDYWNQYAFSWEWYLLLAILIVPWLIVALLLCKQRVKKSEYVIFTLLVAFLASLLDQFGLGFYLFLYPIKIIPAFHTFLPGSLGVLPAVFLLLFHYYYTNPMRFFAGVMLFAVATSFIAQPLLVYWNMYVINRWHYTASFVTIVFIAASARYLTNKFTITSPPEKKNTSTKIIKIEISKRWFRQKAR